MIASARARSLLRRLPSPPRQVSTQFDPEQASLWVYMQPRGRPCFSPELLAEFGEQMRRIAGHRGVTLHRGREHRIEYVVTASRIPGVFSYGGDLSYFRAAILDGDRDALMRYGRQCVDIQAHWSHGFDLPITTVGLVQGEALGGGLECALTNEIVVAEESSRMGFPEIRFGLFPGMGAYSFLTRKVGRRIAERMITSGALYSARELHEMGVVDVLAPDGAGEAAVRAFIERRRREGGSDVLDRVRDAVEPAPRWELYRIAEIWADEAMRLGPRDLALMDRLVRAQDRASLRAGA